jgi:hypothetical protein
MIFAGYAGCCARRAERQSGVLQPRQSGAAAAVIAKKRFAHMLGHSQSIHLLSLHWGG